MIVKLSEQGRSTVWRDRGLVERDDRITPPPDHVPRPSPFWEKWSCDRPNRRSQSGSSHRDAHALLSQHSALHGLSSVVRRATSFIPLLREPWALSSSPICEWLGDNDKCQHDMTLTFNWQMTQLPIGSESKPLTKGQNAYRKEKERPCRGWGKAIVKRTNIWPFAGPREREGDSEGSTTLTHGGPQR